MISISRKIITSVLGALTLSTIIMSGIMYFSAKDEINELYNENMKQIAIAVANQNTSFQFEPDTQAMGRKGLRGEEEFLIQVWKDQDLQYSSLPVLNFARQSVEGHGKDQYNNDTWYFYAIKKHGLHFQVAQPANDRQDMFLEVYSRLLIPILIQLPVIAILITILIRQGFVPLRRLSQSIERRTPSYLEKLPMHHVPIEIKSMVEALNNLFVRLSNSLTTQRRFTADAAHELRTPITAIRLQLDLLSRAKDEKDRQETIGLLFKSVDRATHLIEQLLTLARQEPESLESQWEVRNLCEIVKEAIQNNQSLADSRDTKVSMVMPDSIMVEGEAYHLMTMISNIVNNAIRYTPSGGMVNITLLDRGDHSQLDISDTGSGIRKEDQDRIFDRFYRASSKENGAGLGLSIVKSIADHHGIEISVYSDTGTEGTLFRLLFPKKITS